MGTARPGVPGHLPLNIGVGDKDGAGSGSRRGFRDLDAGGLLGLDLRPPCRVDVGGVLACLRLALQGGCRARCGLHRPHTWRRTLYRPGLVRIFTQPKRRTTGQRATHPPDLRSCHKSGLSRGAEEVIVLDSGPSPLPEGGRRRT